MIPEWPNPLKDSNSLNVPAILNDPHSTNSSNPPNDLDYINHPNHLNHLPPQPYPTPLSNILQSKMMVPPISNGKWQNYWTNNNVSVHINCIFSVKTLFRSTSYRSTLFFWTIFLGWPAPPGWETQIGGSLKSNMALENVIQPFWIVKRVKRAQRRESWGRAAMRTYKFNSGTI